MIEILIKDLSKDIIIGYLSFFECSFDYDNTITIHFINVLEEYRGKGFGTLLLWSFYDYVTSESSFKKIRYIEWDDCSDNFRTKNNIYVKIGAKYVHKNGPEMIWKIRTKKIREKRESYNNKDYKDNYNIIIEKIKLK